MASLQRLSDASESVCECLLRLQHSLSEEQPLYGDVQTVQVLTNEHRMSVSLSHSLSFCVSVSVSVCLSASVSLPVRLCLCPFVKLKSKVKLGYIVVRFKA